MLSRDQNPPDSGPPVNIRIFSPIWVGVVDQEYGEIPECLYDTGTEYEQDIRTAIRNFLAHAVPDGDLMNGFSLPQDPETEAAVRAKVHAARLDVCVEEGSLCAVVDVECADVLSGEELEALLDHIEGQYRDGWGADFELTDIPTAQGELIFARMYNDCLTFRAEETEQQPASGQGLDMTF